MKTTNKQENGHTMGEMLSTLSIMGLLSLGGLLAFNSVIENFRIGSLCDEISARAIYASSKFKSQNKNQVVFRKFKHDYALGQFEKSTTLVKNAFTIVINQIKDDICQKVKKRFEEQNTTALFVCNLEQQKALITFYKNLKSTSGNPIVPCNNDDMCGACEICGPYGFCEPGCPEGSQCAKDFDTPTNGKSCCPNENVVDGACCANPDGFGNCCDESGDNCCPPDKPILGKNGTCYGCDENVKIEVDQRTEKCTRCENRTYRNATYGYIGWCIPNECPEEAPLMSYEGICYECGSKVATRDVTGGAGSNESCARCPDENAIFDDKFCLPCPADMIVENGQCTCENGFMPGYSIQSGQSSVWTNSDPTCYSCDDDNLNAIAFFRKHSSNPCDACPNRIKVYPQSYYYYYCALETCPDGYMHNRYGHCLSCSGTDNIEFQPSSLTNSCSECGGLRYTDGNYCKRCPTDKSTLTETQCTECLGSWDGTVCQNYQACDSENECIAYNSSTQTCENMCQSVEYLESTGTQWIDTGVIPQYNFKFETKILLTTVSDDYFSSCRIDSGNTRFYALNMNSDAGFATSASSWGGTGYANYMPSNFLNTPHEITSNIQQDKVSINVDGVLKEKTNTVGTISSQTLPLFGAKLNNSSNATAYSKSGTRCYYAKYYLDGSLVRDFIPVISPYGEPCMFDKISQKLFCNSGSGDFKTNLDE